MARKLCSVVVVVLVGMTVFATAAEARGRTLSWASAKRAARYKAKKIIWGWESGTKVDWCIRWSAREVHCGVSAWRNSWDSTLEMYVRRPDCSDGVRVWKKYGVRHTRFTGDRSCTYF